MGVVRGPFVGVMLRHSPVIHKKKHGKLLIRTAGNLHQTLSIDGGSK